MEARAFPAGGQGAVPNSRVLGLNEAFAVVHQAERALSNVPSSELSYMS